MGRYSEFKGLSLLSLIDFDNAAILALLDLSAKVKQEKQQNKFPERLKHKNIALLFEKPSTRTRCAFTVACSDEGAFPVFLSKSDIQIGKKESIPDTARVLSRYFDGIEFRGFSHSSVETLAEYSSVPVWNGLTDLFHPTQVLADLLTIRENFNRLAGLTLCYLGDGRNNMANSLMIGCAKMGINFNLGAPKSLWPERELTKTARLIAETQQSQINFFEDPQEAVRNVEIIYTDVWVSMGEENEPGIPERIASLKPYQVTAALMQASQQNSIFLHCLPAVHDMEVTHEVFESDASKVFDQAENRLHTIKAIMIATICGEDTYDG